MRWKNLTKLIKIITLLSSATGTTINELAEELQLDKRSVHRVFNDLEEMGFPLYDDQRFGEKQKTWHLDSRYVKKLPNIALPDIKLHLGELLALCLAASQFRGFKGTEFETALNSAFNKLELILPDGLLPRLSRLQVLFHSSEKHSKDYTGKEKLIEKLADAMLNQKTCQISYHSFKDNKIKKFDVDPLHFFDHKGGLYTFVRSWHGDIIFLAVERIKTLKVTDKSFEYPKDFNPDERLNEGFGLMSGDKVAVRIWFAEVIKNYIQEREWTTDQKITSNDDGSLLLEMEVPITWELTSWLLSFGFNVKVLSPANYVTEMEQIINKMIGNYADKQDISAL